MIPVPPVPPNRIAQSFSVGAFAGEGGGAVLKWLFPDGRAESFLLLAERCHSFAESLDRTISTGRFERPTAAAVGDDPAHPVNVFLAHQPDIDPADFDGGAGTRMVASWHWHVMEDAIILNLEFYDGRRSILAFPGQLCFYLQRYLREIPLPRAN